MSQDREKIIAEAVEKALAGDMDTINAIEDRVTRSKAKAALAKAKRGQGAKAPVEESSAKEEILQNTNQKVGSKIAEKFPDAIVGEPAETHIQLRAKDWEKVASWLKSEDDLFFEGLFFLQSIYPNYVTMCLNLNIKFLLVLIVKSLRMVSHKYIITVMMRHYFFLLFF